jgi:hypothetical protein
MAMGVASSARSIASNAPWPLPNAHSSQSGSLFHENALFSGYSPIFDNGVHKMARLTPPIRLALFVFVLMAGSATLSALSIAQQSCGDDLKRLTDKRGVELEKINALVRAAKGKPIDPALFCSQSEGLKSAENALIAYMDKNKDWCSVPDDVVASLKENHVKSMAFAARACTVAAQMKKQQAAGAANGAPEARPLPAGPL